MSKPAVPLQPGDLRHRGLLWVTALSGAGLAAYVAWMGYSYYRLPLIQRPFHEMHAAFKPAGRIGLRLGMLSLFLFACIYLYPLRKRIPLLQRIGKTRRWLDFHVLLGLTVPLIVTLHASLKLHGLIGLAYWIMMAIVVSGIAGRYLYAQIPRTVTAAEVSLQDLTAQADSLSAELEQQKVFPPGELSSAVALPDRREVEEMPLLVALASMTAQDLRRPFRVAALRRRLLTPAERILTLGGLRASGHADLETVLAAVRSQSWLLAKILFLKRAGEVFHLWHVVHRPFSYSFALIVAAHITLVLLMGYF
ncbi:MAG: hypothetical protein HY821_09405 [Acidobacteria bacterium]|nr:hypothetical protein [Acidobacteriota bacterium]